MRRTLKYKLAHSASLTVNQRKFVPNLGHLADHKKFPNRIKHTRNWLLFSRLHRPPCRQKTM